MYCPRCASQNNDEAKFCRGCGANLSLIPQALTGSISNPRQGKSEDKAPPNLPNAVAAMMSGFGLIVAAFGALYYAPAGRIWWFWLFIPAFGAIGKGVAELLSARQSSGTAARPAQMMQPKLDTNELPAQGVAPQLSAPPSSVTESTTKLFDESNRQN